MDLSDEKGYKRLLKAMKRIYRISLESEADLQSLDKNEHIHGLVGDIRTTAERALESINNKPPMSWIEEARKEFRDKFGMSYRRAEQFWYREAMSDRQMDREFADAIIHHAVLEDMWRNGERPTVRHNNNVDESKENGEEK